MRIGIYGGAFDPVHLGHLLLAETCLRQAELDRLYFVPTGSSPHRSGKINYAASAEDRFRMLCLAIEGCKEFQVSRFEIDRPEKSYTVDTLRCFKELFQEENSDLFFIVGADMFNDLPNWYKITEILRLATPLVACRPGCPIPKIEVLQKAVSAFEPRMLPIDMQQIDLSSSRIRTLVSQGESIRFQVPKSVENYIEIKNLYRKNNFLKCQKFD